MKFSLCALLASACTGALLAATPQATPEPEPEFRDRFLTNEGRRVHYLDWGTAGRPVFVMLHGIGRSAHSYDHIARELRGDYQVIAMDLRGHGDSDWHADGAYLVEDYVKDLERLVEELGLRNLVLTGSSTGGRVAQVYAGLHPDRVAKLDRRGRRSRATGKHLARLRAACRA